MADPQESKSPKEKYGDHSCTSADESTDEELPDYPEGFIGLQKAYEDIQEIFANVVRDYPEFLYSDEEGGTPEVKSGGGDQTKSDHQKTHIHKTEGESNFVGDYKGNELTFPHRVGGGQPSKKSLSKNTSTGPLEFGQKKVRSRFDDKVSTTKSFNEFGQSLEVDKRSAATVSLGTRGDSLLAVPKNLTVGNRSEVSFQPSQPDSLRTEAFPSTILRKIESRREIPISELFKSEHRPFSTVADAVTSLLQSTDHKHESFANDFIRTSGNELSQSILTNMHESNQSNNTVTPLRPSDVSTSPTLMGGSSSLKLIYSPPIWPHQDNLYKTLSRLPSLRSLVLDDSKIIRLSDLGSMLPNLTTLSVMRCGMKSLNGTMGLSNLENFFAADNFITDPSPLSTLHNLRFVDLSDNQIVDLSRFTFLKGCHGLTCLKLMENEVSKRPNFHTEMRRMIPSLRELRPRVLELHGPEVFDMYDDFPEDEEDYLQPLGWSKPAMSSNIDHVSTGDNDHPPGKEVTGFWGWREEERRLRDVYSPGRSGYKKRAVKSIPYTVDEMDALLEELEASASPPSTAELPADIFSIPKTEDDSESSPSVKSSYSKRVRTVPRPDNPQSGSIPRAKTSVQSHR